MNLDDYNRQLLAPTFKVFMNKWIREASKSPLPELTTGHWGWTYKGEPATRWQAYRCEFIVFIERIRDAWAVLTGRKIATDDF